MKPVQAISKDQLLLFIGFAGITVASLVGAILTEFYALAALPVALLFGYLALIDFKKIFYLLLFFLPLSIDLDFSNGLSIDFPSELLMVALMAIFILFIIARPGLFDARFLTHTITILIISHLFWIGIMVLHAENHMVSFKYFLAKNWYVLTFFFLGGAILRTEKAIKTFFWCIYIPLTLLVIQVLIHFATYSFDFEFVNEPMYPFFRNHVNYAAMVTIFYPYIWLAATWYQKGTFKRRLLNFSKVLYVVAIYLSYTRACYLALAAAAGAYVLINWNLLKPVLIATLAIAIIALSTLSDGNKYMKLAPEYTKTIHHKNFEDHLVATVNLQDVSSMERVYRWIAAFYMVADRPVTGFGPGNFYPYYKRYTVSEFETYTSDNDEKSTVHNYFLLTMVEQGIPGLLIFLTLTFAIFYTAQSAYKRCRDIKNKRIILATSLSLVMVYSNLLLSDLVEVDKTGSLFFLAMGMLVYQASRPSESSTESPA